MFTIFVKQFNPMTTEEILEKVHSELKEFIDKPIVPQTIENVKNQTEAVLMSLVEDFWMVDVVCFPSENLGQVTIAPNNLFTAILMVGLPAPILPELLPKTGRWTDEESGISVFFNSPESWGYIPPAIERITFHGVLRGTFIEGVFISHSDVDEFMKPYIEEVKAVQEAACKELDDLRDKIHFKFNLLDFLLTLSNWRLKNSLFKYD